MDFKKYLTKISKETEKQQKELKALEEKKAAAQATLNDAKESLMAATNSDDPAAYTKAKRKKDEAADTVEFYAEKIERVKDRKIFTSAEIDQIIKEIGAGLKEMDYNRREHAQKLFKDLEQSAAEYHAAVNTANDIMRMLGITVVYGTNGFNYVVMAQQMRNNMAYNIEFADTEKRIV